MALPQQQEFIRPILTMAAGSDHPLRIRDFVEEMVVKFHLSSQDLAETVGGGVPRVQKHAEWSVYLLRTADLLVSEPRGHYSITEAGRALLESHEGTITQAQLKLMATHQDPRARTTHERNSAITVGGQEQDMAPNEHIELGYGQLQAKLSDELLEAIKGISPLQFEQLVVAVLTEMGYGHGQRVGRSGDGGIDGIVTQDPLGFEKVYVQAKQWSTSQIRDLDIRNFSGSLDPHGATKGVFITTSRFNDAARQTASDAAKNNKTILLIDGPELIKLMIEYDVGVVTKAVYRIKEIDENYFADI